MPPLTMHLVYAGFNFTNSGTFGEGLSQLIHDRSLLWQVWAWIADHAHYFVEWLKQPRRPCPV